jgi:hypothetical protein
MLRCSRCGQYYVPGYLDCHCKVMLCLPRPAAVPQLPAKTGKAKTTISTRVVAASTTQTSVDQTIE